MPRSSNTLEQVTEVVRARGGRCLASACPTRRTPLPLVCGNGHRFESDADRLLRLGSWCPHCAGNAPLGLERFVAWAASHGGECLSTRYVNSKTPLDFRCARGHEFAIAPVEFHGGRGWCSACRRVQERAEKLERLREKVRRMRCTLISTAYVDARTKVLVRCERGHEWWIRPDGVYGGKPCPTCRVEAREGVARDEPSRARTDAAAAWRAVAGPSRRPRRRTGGARLDSPMPAVPSEDDP